jgi:hypothetical protein
MTSGVKATSMMRMHNPVVFNPRKRKHSKRKSYRRNPLIVNGKRRHGKRKHSKAYRRNPLIVNGKRKHGKHRKSYRRNPLIVNPASGMLGGLQRMLKKLPLVGGFLATVIGGVGGALGGAVGVLPIDYAMPYVSKYMPSWLKPFGYSVAGLALAGVVKVLPFKLPYQNMIATGLTFAGGAVDTYRWRRGTSAMLSGEDDYAGVEDLGDGELGNSGEALAAVEFADASLADAEYLQGDLSDEEMAAAELGRAAYYRRFRPYKQRATHRSQGGASGHAGQPGLRWGWMIYLYGFDAFQQFVTLPEHRRMEILRQLQSETKLAARKLIGQAMDTTVHDAATAGLLVAA